MWDSALIKKINRIYCICQSLSVISVCIYNYSSVFMYKAPFNKEIKICLTVLVSIPRSTVATEK